jgi:hypothetical protein
MQIGAYRDRMSTIQQHRHDTAWLSELAMAIAEHGFSGSEADAVQLADVLRREGRRHPAIDILRDATQPTVARERAFGLVHGLALEPSRSMRAAAA